MKVLYTAVATSVGGRNGHVKSSDGVLNLEVRSPKEMGGADGPYTNPEQLFAAGYSACFGSALNLVALKQRKRIESSVTAKVSIGEKAEGGFMLAVEMNVNIPGIDQKEAEALVQEAHQVCPYSNATRNNVEVTLKVTTK
ncbi:osmotically inducible protein OsmC [Parabacteroides sp. PF5-5]|uniref:organic hydroperoxide resistance protein n=1 Tax=unclassified Parabacteroides TaxID=2649774 RepID=UPI002476D3DC|nr:MULTISPECIES: organic hydroperoxide resistance protein [unclassified Parabacteroides]MDH6306589.1 osmotically inducible protein OsmC [Parabacteroides sp. PH5-39]MDH6317556.1 osmotically inducible protein OsmC [Parabacteroides sp. PF5-13]MDH6321300.1 osmotically inducible protein OsmC [Parabacteroides sp. PH5-13]MDH6325032.1 osmotically inducible protein OsmC [Parabacteroides sp. PH5-8]MDH6328741.1 osmotically inducible protein OsmC [Parabacteroides sp. PH5-41]